MTPQQREFALWLAHECSESAQAWANEVDTRQRAAVMLRALAAEPQDTALREAAQVALDALIRSDRIAGCPNHTKAIVRLRNALEAK